MLWPRRAWSRWGPLAGERVEGTQDAVGAGVDPDGRDVAPADDPVTVDDEQRSLAEPVALAVHAVAPRHGPLGSKSASRGKWSLRWSANARWHQAPSTEMPSSLAP